MILCEGVTIELPTVDGGTAGAARLRVRQKAALTGESETVEKDAGIFGHGRHPGHGEESSPPLQICFTPSVGYDVLFGQAPGRAPLVLR